MWSFENPTSKQRTIPSPSRPDFTTDAYDVTHAVAKIKDPTTCGRHLDPQAPSYKLPSYREFAIPEPPFKRELNLNINDIEGAQPVSKFVNKNLHGIPSIRTANMDVQDINALQQPHGYLHPRSEDYNNLTTKDVVTRYKTFSRDGIVLAPGHTDAPDAKYFGPCRSPFRDMDYQLHNAPLRTDDIAGVREERDRKLRFKYGLRDETRNANYVVDINGQKRKNVRLTQNDAFIAENSTKYGADRLGQEREPPKTGETVCGKTYGSPDFMKTGAAAVPGFTRPEDIQIVGPDARRAAEASRDAIERNQDTEIRHEMQSDFTHRYAGMKGGLLECACRPEVTGLLPGPGDEFYGPRDFRKKSHQIGCDYRNDGPRRLYQKTLRLGSLENIDERGCEITPKKVYSPIRGTTRRFPTPGSTQSVPQPLSTPSITLQSVDRVTRHRDGYILQKLDTQRRIEEQNFKKQTIKRQQADIEAAEVADLPW